MSFAPKCRLLLHFPGESRPRQFISIISLYKNDKLFEYKITLNGFRKGFFTLVENATLDAVKGLVQPGSRTRLGGGVEIGYHADGSVAYKDLQTQKNLWRETKHSPIKQLSSPTLLLRMAGLDKVDLQYMERFWRTENQICELQKQGNFTCDIYFAKHLPGKSHKPIPPENGPYRNSESANLVDDEEKIELFLHIYEADFHRPYFQVVPAETLRDNEATQK